jgi:peptidyl-Lys metalloendopeptidase
MFFHSPAYPSFAIGSLLLVAAVAVSHAVEPVDLSVRLEPQLLPVNFDEPAAIVYTLRNDSPEDVWVLYWQTPLRGILGDLFEIRLDGQPVGYNGLIVEWATPEQNDFIHIPAGGEVSATVDLLKAYNMSRRGEYSVRYRVPLYEELFVKNANGSVMPVQLNSETVTFWVDRDNATQQRSTMPSFEEESVIIPLASTTNSPVFAHCSTSRQNTLTAALSLAQALSGQARSRLTASTPEGGYADKDYRTWFGCYEVDRYRTVKRNFDAIFSALSTQSFTFFCDDDAVCK